MVTCPKCSGSPFPIVTGAPDFINNGKPVARHGDKTACGATLISGQVVSRWGSESASSSNRAANVRMDSEDREIVYEIIDAKTEKPIDGMTYKLTSGSKTLVDGQTLKGGTSKPYSVNEHPNLSFIAWIKGNAK